MKGWRFIKSGAGRAGSFVIILMAGLGLTITSGEALSAPNHDVGVKIYHWDDGSRMVPVIVWYPAEVSPEAKAFDYHGSVRGEAVYDAEPDATDLPYPLIVFSHGMGGCGNQSVFYTENLAANGYVVAAPDHKDSAMCHIDGGKDIGYGRIASAFIKSGGDLGKTVMNLFRDRADVLADPTYRPREISFVIDKVLELSAGKDKPLAGLVDGSIVGMSGHSFGGWTSLAIGGGAIECTDPDKYTREVCSFLDCLKEETFDKKRCKFELDKPIPPAICCQDRFKDKSYSMRDERVKAILPLGPGSMLYPDYKGLEKIEVPVMIISGAARFEVDWDQNVAKVYERLSPPKYAIKLYKVDHMTVSDVTRSVPVSTIVLPGFRKYRTKKDIYERYSEAFFNAYLKGNEEALAYIQESHDKLVELQKEVD